MNIPDPISQSFVIKIWIEELPSDTKDAVWRGSITHVPSGVRKYVEKLSQITSVVVPYLIELGVDENDPSIDF